MIGLALRSMDRAWGVISFCFGQPGKKVQLLRFSYKNKVYFIFYKAVITISYLSHVCLVLIPFQHNF